jgi:hypothetical protein
MRIRFLEAAQREVDDAVAWYDEREEDLGRDFSTNSTGLFAALSPFRWLQLKSSLEPEDVC